MARIPVVNEDVVVGTAEIGRNGTLTVNLFGPLGRELEKEFVLGFFDTIHFAVNYIPAVKAGEEERTE